MGLELTREGFISEKRVALRYIVGPGTDQGRIYIRETCRRDMHSLIFLRDICKDYYEKIKILKEIYYEKDVFEQNRKD